MSGFLIAGAQRAEPLPLLRWSFSVTSKIVPFSTVQYAEGNGFVLCAPATRNPLGAGLKPGRDSAHCVEFVEKGKNRPFFYKLY
jgi:hypothetical protein